MKKNEELQLDDSIKQNKRGEAILGQLYGPCADFIHPTRNGRKYDEHLWETVFNRPIVKEYFESGGILGELDHPTDRLETCSEKIAICMPEPPKKDDQGHLIARFDILDTPNGRIAYTLAKYGYKLGISSRGNGETLPDVDGTERVDEDTYDFQGFDLVLLPAVKAARLKLQESLQNGKTFKQAINESLNSATPEGRKIMQETLNNLFPKEDIESEPEKVEDKSDITANNDGVTMVKNLQEALLAKQKLEAQIIELQEKLSVCYAKEAKDEEDINRYKQSIRNLGESASNARALQKKVNLLNEQLQQKDILLKQKDDQLNIERKQNISKLQQTKQKQSQLNEALNKNNETSNLLKEKVKTLNENISSLQEQFKKKENLLQENISGLKKNLTIKTTEYSTKLSQANKLIEQYKRTAKVAVDKYIDSQALRLGLKSSEIKNKLPNNYSFNDIDTICENLNQFKINLNNLPINLQSNMKVSMKESKESIIPKNSDDSIDNDLLSLMDSLGQ